MGLTVTPQGDRTTKRAIASFKQFLMHIGKPPIVPTGNFVYAA
ncbi:MULTISPECIES: hypothetical protein [Cyanophyceae]|nr:hypothetical protein [Phormidium sp. FACHB-592]